jgi:hypothetical protein
MGQVCIGGLEMNQGVLEAGILDFVSLHGGASD